MWASHAKQARGKSEGGVNCWLAHMFNRDRDSHTDLDIHVCQPGMHRFKVWELQCGALLTALPSSLQMGEGLL